MTAAAILRDAEAVEALAPAWARLWGRVPNATPFQSPAWLLPWWRHFHPGELFVVAAVNGGELVGLAPFYREDGSGCRRLLPVGISVSDYHDVLLDPAFADAGGRAILEAALGALDWERWEFEELRADAAALRLAAPPGVEEEEAPQSACPTLVLCGREVAQIVPKTKRRKLNLAHNRAARRGTVEVRQADGATAGEALDHLFRLHGSRWEARGESGVLADPTVQAFHRSAAPALAAEGLLRLFVLTIDGTVAAVQYGLHHGTSSYAYLAGFDPSFEFESPGVILMAHAIETALGEGARDFHFLRGQEPYKYGWGAVDRWNRRRTFIRRRLHDAAA